MKKLMILGLIVCVGTLTIAEAIAREPVENLKMMRARHQVAHQAMPPDAEPYQAPMRGAMAQCRRTCQDAADAALQGCIDEGTPPWECEVQAREMLWNCLESECGIEPPTEFCEYQCHQRAGEAYVDCMEQGGAPETCGAQGDVTFRACMANECGMEPPAPPCGAACHEEARAAYVACIEEGGIEEDCVAMAQGVFDACHDANCGDGPPDPTCESVCRHDSEALYQECIEAGGTDTECADAAYEALMTCLVEQCGHEPPESQLCAHDCHVEADAVFHACRQDGGTMDACAGAAIDFLELCLADCGVEMPCEIACARAAEESMAECLAAGGSSSDCMPQTQADLRACLAQCP